MSKTYNKKWTIKRDTYMWKKNYRFPIFNPMFNMLSILN